MQCRHPKFEIGQYYAFMDAYDCPSAIARCTQLSPPGGMLIWDDSCIVWRVGDTKLFSNMWQMMLLTKEEVVLYQLGGSGVREG